MVWKNVGVNWGFLVRKLYITELRYYENISGFKKPEISSKFGRKFDGFIA